ncbi:MAG: hypothetical protein GXP19_08625 [Gammaproteobacteria bacterium]|nr:hypothetical protein [Gammaproteobacteria bacterium]
MNTKNIIDISKKRANIHSALKDITPKETNTKNIIDGPKRRAIVYSALKDILPKKSCIEALWILENKFPVAASFSILAYLDELIEVIDIGDNRSTLNITLTKLLYGPAPTGADPWEEMQSYGSASPKAPSSSRMVSSVSVGQSDATNEMVVFRAMLTGLCRGIHRAGPNKEKKMYDYLVDKIASMDIGKANSANLHLWCKHAGKQDIENITPESAMAKIIHEIYLWSCTYLGPTQADKLFSSVVKETESLQEADSFSPRNLL